MITTKEKEHKLLFSTEFKDVELWRTTDSLRLSDAFKAEADKLGIELDPNERAIARKKA